MPLSVDVVVAGPFMENAYVVGDSDSGEALVIDPGGEVERLAALVARRGLKVTAVLATHGHIDHVAAAGEARTRFGAPFAIHSADRGLLSHLGMQALMFGLGAPEDPTVDRWLEDGEVLSLGAQQVEVLHTPGHSPGGVCFRVGTVIFTGDTLFAGSVGRTDLPGGDGRILLGSIRERLLRPEWDEWAFYPGHGPGGTLGHERRMNPYVGGG